MTQKLKLKAYSIAFLLHILQLSFQSKSKKITAFTYVGYIHWTNVGIIVLIHLLSANLMTSEFTATTPALLYVS
jgi:hypothetical protein